MPAEEKILVRELEPTWFVTYDSAINPVYRVSQLVTRSRFWNRAFPSRKEAYRFLLNNGYLPTQHYEDDLQYVVKSKPVRVTGQLTSDPRSTFDWCFLPIYNRTSVDPYGDWYVKIMVDNVLARMNSRVAGHQVSFPMTLKDFPATVQMIGSAASKLRTAYIAVKHGRFRAAAKVFGIATPKGVSRSKTFSQNWLEYRYGWRLTCYDIQGYLQQIHDLLSKTHVHRTSAMETACGIGSWSWEEHHYLPIGVHAFSVKVHRRTEWSDEVRGGYVYEIVNDALNSAQGFGLLNPLEFAWDAIPWTFVLDWVANVGDVLQAITAFAGKTCKDGWMCRMIQSDSTVYWTDPVKGSGVHSINAGGISFHIDGLKERRFRRDHIGFEAPEFHISFGMDLRRTVDAFALLRSLR